MKLCGTCSAGTRITATPFPRGDGDYSFEVEDANLNNDHALAVESSTWSHAKALFR